MTHFELSKATAEWALKKYNSSLCLYEYQATISSELPDVLCYQRSGGTILFEIKMSRSDFLQDAKKEARKKWRPKVGLYTVRGDLELRIKAQAPDLYYIEAPHLGSARYYVCPTNLIKPEEVPEGWGLIYRSDSRYTVKVRSKKWRANVKMERDLAVHAFRRWASGDDTGVILDTYRRH